MFNVERKEFKSKAHKDLFLAAFDLFSRYGYEGTTVRMIADQAGVSAGQVTFYFESKEKLYHEIIEFIIQETNRVYDPICQKVYALKEQGKLDHVTATEYLQLIIDLQIDFAVNPEKCDDLMLMFSERLDSPDGCMDVNAAITKKIEQLTADLLVAASDEKMNPLKAKVISRAINGGIISFGEHPHFLLSELSDANDVDFMKLYLRNFLQNAIEATIRVAQ